MNLTTADRYLALFPESSPMISKAAELTKLNMRIASVSRNVEKYLGRNVEIGDVVEKFSPDCGTGTKRVRLKAFPIASITSVSVFGSTLEEDTDYNVDYDNGVINFAYNIIRLIPLYENAIVVTYNGGMASSVSDFYTDYVDIEAEVLMQINFELKRAPDIAMKSVSNGQTSSQLNPYGFIDSLITVLNRHKKLPTP